MSRPPELLAISYVRDAAEYLVAATALHRATRGSVHRFSKPVFHLVGHSIELALKAHLLASGITGRVIRNGIGHEIAKACRNARRYRGFQAGDDFDAGLRRRRIVTP